MIVIGVVALAGFIAYYQEQLFGLPIWLSLVVIVVVLAASVITSLYAESRESQAPSG